MRPAQNILGLPGRTELLSSLHCHSPVLTIEHSDNYSPCLCICRDGETRDPRKKAVCVSQPESSAV